MQCARPNLIAWAWGFRFWHCATESKLNFHFVDEMYTSLVNLFWIWPQLKTDSFRFYRPPSLPACLFLGWHPCVVIHWPADGGAMFHIFHAHLGLMLNKYILVDLWSLSLGYFKDCQIKSSFFPVLSCQTFPWSLWSYAALVQQIVVQTRGARVNNWLNHYNAT